MSTRSNSDAEPALRLREQSLWDRYGSWAILAFIALCIGLGGYHLGIYVMHEKLREQALNHQVQLSQQKDEQLQQLLDVLERLAQSPTATSKETENVETTDAGREAEQPRQH